MGCAGRGAVIALCAVLASAGTARANAISDENARPGGTGWNVAEPPQSVVQGYAEVSRKAGRRVHLRIESSTPYRVQVWRLGWYGGKGGRRFTCLPRGCQRERPPVSQPAPPAPDPTTGIVRAGWRTTDIIRTRRSWPSGYYTAVVELTRGPFKGQGYHIPFVLRQGSGRRAPILVNASVNTWQAYNPWGGKSLYASNSTHHVPANHVSFDRPFDHAAGNTTPFSHEIQLVRFLEREGYDVAYQTDRNTDASPGSLLRAKTIIANGHGEYWTTAERSAFDAARDAGRNLIFAGADFGFWHVRYADNRDTIIGYKGPGDPIADPTQRTISFRNLGHPECELVGVQYPSQASGGPSGPHAYTVVADARSTPWMAGTGLQRGEQLPGLVGYEWDNQVAGCGPSGEQLVMYAPGPRPASFVVYRSAAGGWVQSWGSMFFTYALDTFGAPPGLRPQPGVQAYIRNTLDAMAGPGASERTVALGLPQVRRCVAHGRLRLSLRAPKGMRLRSGTAFAGRRKTHLRRHRRRLVGTIALRRHRVTVLVRATTRDGHHLRDQRSYRTCGG